MSDKEKRSGVVAPPAPRVAAPPVSQRGNFGNYTSHIDIPETTEVWDTITPQKEYTWALSPELIRPASPIPSEINSKIPVEHNPGTSTITNISYLKASNTYRGDIPGGKVAVGRHKDGSFWGLVYLGGMKYPLALKEKYFYYMSSVVTGINASLKSMRDEENREFAEEAEKTPAKKPRNKKRSSAPVAPPAPRAKVAPTGEQRHEMIEVSAEPALHGPRSLSENSKTSLKLTD